MLLLLLYQRSARSFWCPEVLSLDLLGIPPPPPPHPHSPATLPPARLMLVPDGRASKKTYCAPEFFKRKVGVGRLGYMCSGVPYVP